ncbi:hypothetical protein BDD12DRAFT_912605 [Trichophaea hybrida]|nr:hypothetical protein BDD12DRAFT_912605 [Trichophaea hybrida]
MAEYDFNQSSPEMQAVVAWPLEKGTYRAELSELLRCGRQEGLFINHQTTPPMLLCRLPPLIPITDLREPFTFTMDGDLADLSCGAYSSEKLSVDNEPLTLIGWTQKLLASYRVEADKILENAQRSDTVKCARLEEPTLRGQFHALVQWNHYKPTEVQVHADDGLTWSFSVKRVVLELNKNIQLEKMCAFAVVCSFLNRNCILREHVEVDSFLAQSNCNWRAAFTTPLLLWPAIKTLRLPPLVKLLLEPEDAGSIAVILHRMLDPLIDKDSLLHGSTNTPSRVINQDLSNTSPFQLHLLPQVNKLEVPLVPDLCDWIPATNNYSLPQWETCREESIEDIILINLTRAGTEQLGLQLAQEQLHHADAIRLKVPVVKLSWNSTNEDQRKMSSFSTLSKLRQQLKSGLITKWAQRIDTDNQLPWIPVTKLHEELPREKFSCRSLEEFLMSDADCANTEENLLRVIRILNLGNVDDCDNNDGHDNSDTELEKPGMQKTILEKVAVLKKMQENAKDGNNFDKFLNSPKHELAAGAKNHTKIKKKGSRKSAIHYKFTAANSLNAFMALRGVPSATSQNQTPTFKGNLVHVVSVISTDPSQVTLLSTPKSPSHFPIAGYIVSPIHLPRRMLFHIKALYPAACLIERDVSILTGNGANYSPYLTASTSRFTDADLILSPTTGLVMTTLPRLRQRFSLPGENRIFTCGANIKKRIMDICGRYERLLVIIQFPSYKITSKCDLEVIAAFLGFASTISGECILESRVIEGGLEDIVQWVVGMMVMGRHGNKLIEDEMMREQFLRQVGLNSFASQVVLSGCQEHDGLSSLLRNVRKRRFESLVGVKVRGRVGSVMSTVWEDTRKRFE